MSSDVLGLAAARRAHASASASSFAAPRTEFVAPLRSLVPAINGAIYGAESGVLVVVSSAFRPFTRCSPTAPAGTPTADGLALLASWAATQQTIGTES